MPSSSSSSSSPLVTHEAQRGNLLCLWGLLSSAGQEADIHAMCAMETQRRDSWPSFSCLPELRKVTVPPWASASSSVSQGDKLMTSKVLYAAKMFPPPSDHSTLSFPPLAGRFQLHPLGWWLSFGSWQFTLCLPWSDVNSRPRAQDVTCSAHVSGGITGKPIRKAQ